MKANISSVFMVAGFLGSALIIAYGVSRLAADPPQSATPAAPAPEPTLRLIVAGRPIRRGEQIRPDDIGTRLPLGAMPATAVTQPQAAIGKYAVVNIAAGTPLLSDTISDDPTRAGLAPLVKAGFRAIQLRTTDEIAVGNFIRAGDHVDIQLVLPDQSLPGGDDTRKQGSVAEARMLLQDITVLAVGDQLGEPSQPVADATARRPDPPHSLTVALTPEQVSIFTLGRGLGVLFLTLRNPSDTQAVSTPTVRLADIRGATPPASGPVAQSRRAIELITGGRARTIYSQSGDHQ
jgi:pilus assembly protein CpaB